MMKWERLGFCFLALLMLLATVEGALAWSWFGLFPEKVVMPDVQFKTEPVTLLDRLNNFFLQHQEFRSLPEGTSIGVVVRERLSDNMIKQDLYLITSRGVYNSHLTDKGMPGEDANIWVSQSFLERLLSTNDVCGFFKALKLSPEGGVSYGLISHRNVFALRWKYGSGNNYCSGGGLWP